MLSVSVLPLVPVTGPVASSAFNPDPTAAAVLSQTEAYLSLPPFILVKILSKRGQHQIPIGPFPGSPYGLQSHMLHCRFPSIIPTVNGDSTLPLRSLSSPCNTAGYNDAFHLPPRAIPLLFFLFSLSFIFVFYFNFTWVVRSASRDLFPRERFLFKIISPRSERRRLGFRVSLELSSAC